jgi:hypothetical protein
VQIGPNVQAIFCRRRHHYAQQAANLSGWSGDYSHDEWRKFRREFEGKLTPLWVRRQIDEIKAELVGERTRREGANVAIGQKQATGRRDCASTFT